MGPKMPIKVFENGLADWPSDWPWYKQGCFASYDDRCDAVIGPCACGAWHKAGEFDLIANVLHRYGKPVPSHWPQIEG